MEELLAGAALALFSALVGGFISGRGAKKEREWQEQHAVRERQAEDAARLDAEFREAMADCPTAVGPVSEVGPLIAEAQAKMLRAFSSSILLDDREVTERVRALDLAMLIATQRAQALKQAWHQASLEPEPTINPWPISVAAGEVRTALSCFARRIDPPPAKFPRAGEVLELSTDDGREVGLDRVMELLMDRRAPP